MNMSMCARSTKYACELHMTPVANFLLSPHLLFENITRWFEVNLKAITNPNPHPFLLPHQTSRTDQQPLPHPNSSGGIKCFRARQNFISCFPLFLLQKVDPGETQKLWPGANFPFGILFLSRDIF